MNRLTPYLVLILTTAASTSALAQGGPAERFSSKKAQRELQVMAGILQTTLGFVNQEGTDRAAVPFRSSDSVRGYYLYDQGAMFLVSVSSLGPVRFELMSVPVPEFEDLAALGAVPAPAPEAESAEEAEKRSREAERISREAERMSREAARLRARLKDEQLAAKEKMQAYLERIEEVQEHLIEALADHGDSLTLVEDDQYINLILVTGSGFAEPFAHYAGGARSLSAGTDIVSIKMSWIRDYRSERLSLSELKAKVLRY